MRHKSWLWRLLAVLVALTLVAAACGSDDDGGGDESAEAPAEDAGADEGGDEGADEGDGGGGDLVPVRLQLQWVPQSQFAGYFAAVDQGFYEEVGLDVTILEGGVDIVPATVLDSGAPNSRCRGFHAASCRAKRA